MQHANMCSMRAQTRVHEDTLCGACEHVHGCCGFAMREDGGQTCRYGRSPTKVQKVEARVSDLRIAQPSSNPGPRRIRGVARFGGFGIRRGRCCDRKFNHAFKHGLRQPGYRLSSQSQTTPSAHQIRIGLQPEKLLQGLDSVPWTEPSRIGRVGQMRKQEVWHLGLSGTFPLMGWPSPDERGYPWVLCFEGFDSSPRRGLPRMLRSGMPRPRGFSADAKPPPAAGRRHQASRHDRGQGPRRARRSHRFCACLHAFVGCHWFGLLTFTVRSTRGLAPLVCTCARL